MTAAVPTLLTLSEAAAILRVTESWLTKQLRSRALPGRKICRQWRMTTGDIEQAIELMASPAIVAKPDPFGLTRTSRRRANRRAGVA